MLHDPQAGYPPYAPTARFDAQFDGADRTDCLVGTRTDIINQIATWADQRLSAPIEFLPSGDGRDDDSARAGIFWVNGSAGTGKTTIAFTMAKFWALKHILGASFFCSRDDATCSDPQLIITTIAYQLGQFDSSFGDEVSKAMKLNPDIGYASLSFQLEKLIVNPLRALKGSFRSCVVVIDALDECKDKGITSEVLSALALFVGELSQLSFLLTSRPVHRIEFVFQSDALQAETRRFVLHEVQLDVVQNDIERYINVKLHDQEWRSRYAKLEHSWPSELDIQTLSRLSAGLFIFAATCVKFIQDRDAQDPKDQLDRLLCVDPFIDADSSPHRRLDQLYTQVLNHAHPNPTIKLSGRLKLVLGSLVHLQDRLSVIDLEHLLQQHNNHNDVKLILVDLHSIVLVPDDDAQAIRMLHPSFFDFLTDRSRCRNPKFVVNTRLQHALLARACLRVMCSQLGRNMCQLPSPATLNAEIEHIGERITTHIPFFLQYACRHWASHFAHAMLSDDLLQTLQQFVDTSLLHWIEICSLLGELRGAIIALDFTSGTDSE